MEQTLVAPLSAATNEARLDIIVDLAFHELTPFGPAPQRSVEPRAWVYILAGPDGEGRRGNDQIVHEVEVLAGGELKLPSLDVNTRRSADGTEVGRMVRHSEVDYTQPPLSYGAEIYPTTVVWRERSGVLQ